jgi:hypothetical protein
MMSGVTVPPWRSRVYLASGKVGNKSIGRFEHASGTSLYPQLLTYRCGAANRRFGRQKATWLRSSGLECFAKLCDHRQRYCGAVVPVTRLALVAFGVFSGTGHAPR